MGLNYKSDYSPELILNMMKDTSILISSDKEQNLVDFFVANASSSITNKLTDEVEFWQWMSRNWKRSGIFDSAQNYNNYIVDAGKKFWAERQIQGKAYEWDWMRNERGKLKNILKQYNAGDISNRPGSDVTVHDFLTGKTEECQMKAYTSGNSPVLDNTDTSIKVVTNSENIDTIQKNGYKVEPFQDNQKIIKNSQKRVDAMEKGTAKTAYTPKNVAGVMAKAGAIGFVIGVTAESIASYSKYKNGELTEAEYITEVLKSGGNAGIDAAATAGIMVPVSAAITAAGISSVINIPIAFVVGAAIDKIVAPCFGRGDYKKILSEAQYYSSIAALSTNVITSMSEYSNQCKDFYDTILQSENIHYKIGEYEKQVDKDLADLYNSI